MIVRRLRGIRRIVIRRAPILPWKLHSANRYNIFLVHPVEKKKKKGRRNYTKIALLRIFFRSKSGKSVKSGIRGERKKGGEEREEEREMI